MGHRRSPRRCHCHHQCDPLAKIADQAVRLAHYELQIAALTEMLESQAAKIAALEAPADPPVAESEKTT